MKKKIFIATGLYPPESGGPATYTKLLEERLPARGFDVLVLPFSGVRHLPKGIRHIVYFFMCIGYAMMADMVYAQDTLSVGLPAALAAKVAGKPFLARVPGDYVWEQGRQRFGVKESLDEFQPHLYGWKVRMLHRLQAFVMRRATYVIAPSAYLASIVAKWGVPGARIKIIHNGIGFPLAVTEPAQRPEGFLIVTIARRVPWKGIDGIERVVAREKNWHLFVADTLPRAEALGWAQAADAFVLNSSYEGLSHTLIEVMSLGTPIVATNIGGNPELVRDGVEGLLIPATDDEALHQALKKIEQDPASARQRAAAAAARATREFTIEDTLDKLSSLLETV